MRAVSGTSGAAPVWRDVITALGGESGRLRLRHPASNSRDGAIRDRLLEQPRREWFVRGTALAVVARRAARRRVGRGSSARSPAASMRSIPTSRPIASGWRSRPAATSRSTGCGSTARDLGAAGVAPAILTPPGCHCLRLTDLGGKVIDQVVFTMR